MVGQTKHCTLAEKRLANAQAAQKKRTLKLGREQSLLRRHPNSTALLARGQARRNFLKEIKDGTVVLEPDGPSVISNVTSEEQRTETTDGIEHYLAYSDGRTFVKQQLGCWCQPQCR